MTKKESGILPKKLNKIHARWVIKAGSNMICSGGPLLIRSWMNQVARLRREQGIEVIWVSSGAIATAIDRTQFKRKNKSLSEKQALAAIGQPMVMDLYQIALQTQGMMSAQVLLTYEDLASKKRKRNLQNTIEQLLNWQVTPILNENDAVATEEIKFGDNDSLSARVAKAMRADRLIILTDVAGVYDQDPRQFKNAQLISEVKRFKELKKVTTTQGAGTARGTGGMTSKLEAAKLANRAGIETWLVKGDAEEALIQISKNARIGTRILA